MSLSLDAARVVEDPARMREILQRHLITTDGRQIEIHACTLSNQRYRNGARGTVQFDLQLVDLDTGLARTQIVTGVTYGAERTRRVWANIRAATPPSAPTETATLQPFSYVPELDMLVQVFPHDHRLPALALLMAGPVGDVLPPMLSEFGPGEWRLDHWDAAVVQYRADMRAILRLDVTATDMATRQTARRPFYAKIFRDADSARRSFQTQTEIYERVAAGDAGFSVARPIAHGERLRTVVTEAIPGISLAAIIRRGGDQDSAVRAAARAVAAFHATEFAAPARPLAADVARLRQSQEILQISLPDQAAEIAATVDAIATGLADAPLALIHGDLKPEHLLLDGDRVALLDFDLIGIADPVTDVAHLLAFLSRAQERTRGKRDQHAPDSASQVFCNEYFSHVPPSWRTRLALHHAATSIHKAVGMTRRHGLAARDQVQTVLREGHALLTGASEAHAPTFKRRITRATTR